MDKLYTDARQLADDLRATNPKSESLERNLLNALEPFLRTLEADGRPQRGSTYALGRFCIESMDYSSPLYARCVGILERARSRLR